MTSNNDKDDIYKFSFDGITLGEAYRQYRKLLLDEAAGTTDESGSSLADHLLDMAARSRFITERHRGG
jgi:hypothetical protein